MIGWRNSSSCGGFTLFEMLVILVVIGLLAGLAIPAYRSGIEMARRAECIGQLRQIGVAIALYCSENGQKLPYSIPYQGPRWYAENSELADFVGGGDALQELAVCPENRGATKSEQGRVGNAYGYPYVVNYNIMPNAGVYPDMRPVFLPALAKPSNIVMMMDSQKDSAWIGEGMFGPGQPGWQRVAFSHDGKAGVLWVDGHVTVEPTENLRYPEHFKP